MNLDTEQRFSGELRLSSNNQTFLPNLEVGGYMRKHGAEWLGSLGLVLTIGISAAAAQTMPSAGLNALEQAIPETPSSALAPVSGLNLDTPIGSELLRDVESDQPGPGDGLRLQFYDTRSPAPALGSESHGAQGSQNP